jgi:hypothetical protein
MARIRTIKPDFFRHEGLYELEKSSKLPIRIAFAGLWTVADREGRFAWRPNALKLDCLPYDVCDFADVMDALASKNHIVRYIVDGRELGFIPSWHDHQVINTREAQSLLPVPDKSTHMRAHAPQVESGERIPNGHNIPGPLRETVFARDGGKCVRCFSDQDLTVDHIFPQSIGGTHAITNLRCMCRSCNSARPVQGQALIDDLAKDGLTLNDMQRMCTHMPAQAQESGEGKGKEGEGKGREEASSLRSDSSVPSATDPSPQAAPAKPALELLPPADLNEKKTERLRQVTADAIESFNATLAVPIGVMSAVKPKVGSDTRLKQVRRCLKVAREICVDQFSSATITRQFWDTYFAECSKDDFSSGRQAGGRGHENWQSSFEYLTREEVMLKIFDKATSQAAA